jgi:hypothetical protein
LVFILARGVGTLVLENMPIFPGEGMDKSFKQRLEENPFAVAAVVAVASGTIVAGVAGKLSGQMLENTKTQYEQQNNNIKEKYESQLSQLNKQYNSLERSVGNARDEKFIDISKMQIFPADVSSLDTSYVSYMDSDIFVSVPSDSNWNFSIGNELDYVLLAHFDKKIQDEVKNNDVVEFANNLKNAKVLIWKSKSAIVFHSIHQSAIGGKDNEAFAFVTIERFDNEVFKQRLKVLSLLGSSKTNSNLVDAGQKISEGKKGESEIRDAPSEELQKEKKTNKPVLSMSQQIIKKQEGEAGNTEKKESAGSADESAENANNKEDKDKPNNKEDEGNNRLLGLYNDDAAGIILVDTLGGSSGFASIYPDLKWSLVSVQKKLNAMYVDSDLKFSPVSVEKNEIFQCSGEENNIFIKRESIYLSVKEYGYMIRTSVPSCRRRGPASEWVSKWLSTLRVVAANF